MASSKLFFIVQWDGPEKGRARVLKFKVGQEMYVMLKLNSLTVMAMVNNWDTGSITKEA